MKHLLAITFVLLIFGITNTTAQSSNPLIYWSLTNPDSSKTLALEQFLPIIFNESHCIAHGKYASGLNEMGRDSAYMYFEYFDKGSFRRYRVLISDLESIKFDKCIAQKVVHEFFNTFVAETDRTRKSDPFICTSTPAVANYSYKYIDSLNALEIRLHWKIYCEIVFKLVNKKYAALYHFDTSTFTPIE